MGSIEIAEAGREHVLTLLLKRVLERNLGEPVRGGLGEGRGLRVRVRSGEMASTFLFEGDRIRAESGSRGRADVEIAGGPAVLLAWIEGEEPLRVLIRRGLRVRGRGWRGWSRLGRILALFRARRREGGAGGTSRDVVEGGGA